MICAGENRVISILDFNHSKCVSEYITLSQSGCNCKGGEVVVISSTLSLSLHVLRLGRIFPPFGM